MKAPEFSITQLNPENYGLHPQLPEVFDSTTLSDYQRCPSLFYHRHVLGLTPKLNNPNVALLWGTLWHEAMEIFHEERDIEKAKAHLEAEGKWPAELDFLDEKGRTLERMLKLLDEYAGRYGRTDLLNWTTLRREQPFTIDCRAGDESCPFGGCDLTWSGRMDRIAQNIDGSMWMWDYKTTAWYRQSTADSLKHGLQFKGYYWAACHLVKGQEIEGVVADLLYVVKTKAEMHRFEFDYRRNPAYILEWIENVRGLINQITCFYEDYSHEPEACHKSWRACEDFGSCIFKDIHYTPPLETSRGNTRLNILSEDYVEHRWSPYNDE